MFSKTLVAAAVALASLSQVSAAFTYNRLNKSEAAVLVVDIQSGLFQLVHDIEPRVYRNNILGYSALAKYFELPTVLTTSAETGPNGPFPKEILADHPDAPYIKRNGEVNAWDNKEFRDAVAALGKKQLIVAGITTDVCVTFLSLSLREAGYDVFVVADASGTFDPPTADLSNQRMLDAGVQILSLFSTGCELMRDWRDAPGGVTVAQQFFAKWFPSYDNLITSWLGASNQTETAA
ncbi:isochorismatase hydrolase [Exidia glandulosa HHB12029]|uniref:Isochorismatase hydrolase n=1 Tax=Exidia glandulosa HHB12029 TaxID=1314781 RepID=A0A166AXV5_EXIGL|nr:isochorismatase hydrolase [Exidia glandulosa HHB12029]